MAIKSRSIYPQNNFTIKTIRILNSTTFVDVTSIFVKLDLYEGINKFMNGTVILDDTAGICDILDFKGEETIDIYFCSYSGSSENSAYKKSFRISNASRQIADVGNFEEIKIDFENNIYIENELVKYNRVFSNQTNSQIVNTILGNFNCLSSYTINIEETLHARTFKASLQSPLSIIEKLKPYSYSKSYNSSTFFLYEDRDAIEYKSLGAMKSQDQTYTIQYTTNSLSVANSGSSTTLYANEMFVEKVSDTVNKNNSPSYGDRVVTINNIDKTSTIYSLTDTKFFKNWDTLNTIDTDDLDNPDSITTVNKPFNATYILPMQGDFYNPDSENYNYHSQGVRAMERESISTKIINARIPGNSAITCGLKVYVKYPLIYNKSETTVAYSKGSSGYYLITSIHHTLSHTDYFQELQLISDSDGV